MLATTELGNGQRTLDGYRKELERLTEEVAEVLSQNDGVVHLHYSPRDTKVGDPESKGHLAQGNIEFEDEDDFLRLDLRDDDVKPQLVAELDRIGQLYCSMAVKLRTAWMGFNAGDAKPSSRQCWKSMAQTPAASKST